MQETKKEFLKLVSKADISIYRLCKETKTDQANISKWLNQPKRKLNAETYNKLIKYLKSCVQT